MSTFTALFDACVLYRVSVTDLIMRLAATGLYRARWTNEIHEEWINALRQARPDLEREALERRRDAMNRGAEGCLVAGYEPLIESLSLPDPKDCHVLAAAIRTRAHVIVTYNLGDFPSSILEPLGIEAQHPDQFVWHLINLDPQKACAAVRTQRQALRNPAKSVDELLDSFRKAGMSTTVERLLEFRDLL